MQRREIHIEPLTITLNVAGVGGTDQTAVLQQILTLCQQILAKETTMGQQFTDMKALISALNDETNDTAAKVQGVSDRIDRLIAGIPAGGLSAEEAEQLKTDLGSIRDAQQPIQDRLEALGQDAAQPIPPTP